MSDLSVKLRIAGIFVCLLGLAACTPPTPNAAAETPFVPTAAPTNTVPAQSETAIPDSYPAPTEALALPEPTTAPESYPPTEDPYEAGAATVPPAPTAPPDPVFITYRDFEIVPAQSTAKVGQQVIFLIESASGAFHQPYAGAAAPFIFEAPPNMGGGVSWPITFNNAQTLTILCGYHGNMRATLVIEP